MSRQTSFTQLVYSYASCSVRMVVLSLAVFFVASTAAMASSVPLGGHSQVTNTTLGRRVVLKWPIPALYPGLTIGGLVCVPSGQAPYAIDLIHDDGSLQALKVEQVSPLCLSILKLDVRSSEPMRFLVSFENGDSAQFPVFPETGPRRDRFDFVTFSDDGLAAVLQVVNYRKTGSTHAGVLCTTTQGKIKSMQLAREGGIDAVNIATQPRADGCFSIAALNFYRPGVWELKVRMSTNEEFVFRLSAQ